MEFDPESMRQISAALGDVVQRNQRSLSVADRLALEEAKRFLEIQASKPLRNREIIEAIGSAISVVLRVFGIWENR